MITKTVKRHFCEFCKKQGGHSGHMKAHEKHCTGNPNRHCKFCDLLQRANGDTIQQPIHVLMLALENGGVDGVRLVADGCPACILAAMVQLRKAMTANGDDEEWWEFDYKKERDALFERINPQLAEQDAW